MALKLTQKKATSTREVVATAELVDQYGDNYRKIEKLKEKAKKLADELKPLVETDKKLAAEIEALYPGKGEDEEFVIEGNRFYLDMGKKGSSRSISDMKHVRKVMKDEVFFQVAKVNMGDIDKYLTKAEQDKCITTERTERSRKVRDKKA